MEDVRVLFSLSVNTPVDPPIVSEPCFRPPEEVLTCIVMKVSPVISHQQTLPHFNLLLPLPCQTQIWSSFSSISNPSVSSSDLGINPYSFADHPGPSPCGFSLYFLFHFLPFSCHAFWKFLPLCLAPLGFGVFIQIDTSAHIYLCTTIVPFSFVFLGNCFLSFIY